MPGTNEAAFYPPVVMPPNTNFPVVYKKSIPTTPAPAPGDNPPFPGTRFEIINIILDSWNLPFVPAQSKQRLRSFYNAKWDIPDDPPRLSEGSPYWINRSDIIIQNYLAQQSLNDFYTYHMLSGSVRGKRRSGNPALLPSTDNPPPYELQQRLFQILNIHYIITSQLVYDTTQVVILGGRERANIPIIITPPPTIFQPVGLIAFQPNAFQIGYPRHKIAFQGRNRHLRLKTALAKPFIRFVTLAHRNRFMEDHKPGDAIPISVYTYDPSSLPETLFTPEEVRLTLYNPDRTVRVDNQLMSVVSTGFHTYIHQSATNDQVRSETSSGVYTVVFTGKNFGKTGITLRQEVFRLIED